MFQFLKKELTKILLKLIKKNVLMANYRQRVINNKSIYAALLLLIHGLNTYHKKRAWLMELKIGLNGVWTKFMIYVNGK